jgi:sialate O-acetylesterase
MIRVCFVLLLVAFVAAQDTDYKLIGSNMILQRDSDKVRLWGQTTGSTSAMLTIFSSGKQVDLYTTAVTHNMWEIKLKPYAAGGPYDFVVKTGAEIKYTNVYFGDVFLCSGQSNMEFVVVQSVNGSQEVEDSKNYPQL